MTRKRTRESLAHLLCKSCEVCQGRGAYKTAQTIAYEIMRELMRESKQFDAKEFKVIASSSVINFLQDEESQSLANLSDFINKRVTLQADSQYSREEFDVVWS
jgi:ribonuclease G